MKIAASPVAAAHFNTYRAEHILNVRLRGPLEPLLLDKMFEELAYELIYRGIAVERHFARLP
jgi:hypothetical protein